MRKRVGKYEPVKVEIDTLWNVKNEERVQSTPNVDVEIDTLWNVK